MLLFWNRGVPRLRWSTRVGKRRMLDVGWCSVPTVAALAPGQVLDGKYRVLREIGSGAMGLVYEAVHVALGRRVAIKTLRADTSEDPDLV